MDQNIEKVIGLLKRFLGNSAGLVVLKEIKDLNLSTNTSEWDSDDKEGFIDSICNDILRRFMSSQKIRVYRSKLAAMIDADDYHNNITEVESIDW